MKRPHWLVLLVLLGCIQPAFADIADNFMAGGILSPGAGLSVIISEIPQIPLVSTPT